MNHTRTWRIVAPAVLLAGFLAGQQQQTSGLTARSSPDSYAAHASAGERTYAASLLTSDQVKHIFASDISRKYVVLEVACYPQAGAIDIHPDLFVLGSGHDGKDVVRPADAMTVAARMQQKKESPSLPGLGDNQVYTSAEIGHSSGTDPYTGRKVSGTYESVGVGVAHGGPDSRTPTVKDDWPQNMEGLQRQLEDHAFPAGRFDHPVAGYLYYPADLVKKDNKSGYRLKYDGSPDETALLLVPLRVK